MATASEPLGFFDLPREIRDEIYRHSFSKSYTVPNIGRGREIHDAMMLMSILTSGGPSESHVLQILQKMRFEAEEVLYHDSTFHLRISKSIQPSPSQELADRFVHLRILIHANIFTRHNCDYDYPVLEKFGGSRARGKTCTKIFHPGYLVHWIPHTRLFNILKTFIGFETVRIQVSGPILFSQQKKTRRKQDNSQQKQIRRMQDSMRPMRESLECALSDAIAFENSKTRGIEFHPQDRASAHNA